MRDSTDPLDPTGAAERWQRVRALVEAALEREESERLAFVEAEAGTDEALRSEVLQLLEMDTRTGLEAPEGRAFEALAARPPQELPQLGRWKILREIGSGGMGTVYLGVRDDGQFKKRVAIKLIKRGMDTDEVLRRFDRERQVLASLDHPGIARLLDGGVSDDGRPYLVLEYVEGEPLDRWCDQHRLTVRERLKLFCEVCAAVDDAHRSLVVHRDLKPGNVLVDSQGRPRLLDFGIAKVLDPERDDQTALLTATPLRLMTPAYASPEQVRGSSITTASDVYSLGAILYQLLTGRPPLKFETGHAAEVERMVAEEEPTRCSQAVVEASEAALMSRRVVSRRAIARGLEGDLDTVVAKALRKEPRRRYHSAAELAEDVQRHLRGLPVTARPDTFGYRAGKFVRRNRLAVASAVGVLLALVAGLAVSLWQFREARQVGQLLAQRNATLSELNEELERERGSARDSQRLAERRARELEELAEDLRQRRGEAEAARAAALGAEEEAKGQRALAERRAADLRGFATTLIFDIHRALVPVESALAARGILVRTGIDLLDSLRQEGDLDPRLRREIVSGYLRIAEVQGDDAADTFGDVDAALASLEVAVTVAEELQAEDPDSLANDFTLGSALMSRGDTLVLAGRPNEARDCFERAAQVCGANDEQPSSSQGREYVLAECLLRLGGDSRQRGDLDGARGYYEGAMVRLEALALRLPSLRSSLAGVFYELGQVERAAGDLILAETFLREGETMLEELLAEEPGQAAYQRQLAMDRVGIARLLIEMEEYEEALAMGRRLRETLSAGAATAGGNLQAERMHITSLDVVAEAAGKLEQWEEAFDAAHEAVEGARRLVEEQPGNGFYLHDLGRAYLRVGLLSMERGLLLDAEDAQREAVDVFEAFLQRDPASPFGLRSLRNAQQNLAVVCLRLADREGLGDDDRAQWMRRARSFLLDTSATNGRLSEVSEALPQDLDSRSITAAELERVEASLADLGG